MFKRFFFQTLSSFTGTMVALVIAGGIIVAVIGGMVSHFAGSSNKEKTEVKKGSILSIKLEGDISECEKPFSPSLSMLMSGNLEAPQTLRDLSASLKEAAINKDIAAVYLKCGSLVAGPATLDALRNDLLKFKKETKGQKKIYAYADDYSQGSYYVASVADSIFLNPEGSFAMRGLAMQNFYFKDLLDKVGIKMQIAKVGTYKSAVEPFTREGMSEPARAQLDTMITNMWGYLQANLCKERKDLTPRLIDTLINRDNISFAAATLARKYGLVDALIYDREMKRKLAIASRCEVEDLNLVDSQTLLKKVKPADKDYDADNRIAVLYAVGNIEDGNESEIDYNKIVPIIDKLAEDTKVKALVLRVNSPGGSVYGSAQIGEALDHFQAKGKPVVVSMGDYAASGGYWISAKADRIFSDPMTLTGSIGIYGRFPCIEGTVQKLGVNVDMVATNPEAVFPNLFEPLEESQHRVLQAAVERGYDQFVKRVSEGRHMPEERVRRIADGRVWDGQMAVKIGLVDQLGGLEEAIAYVAEMAKIGKDFKLAAYPEYNPSLFDIMMSGGVSAACLKNAIQNRDATVIGNYLMNRLLSLSNMQAYMGGIAVKL